MMYLNWARRRAVAGPWRSLGLLVALTWVLAACSGRSAQPVQIGVLLFDDIRLEPFQGVKDGLEALGYVEGEDLVYTVYNAQGDRAQLSGLAESLISAGPALALAGGGVEADSLRDATAETGTPVVFLAVASSVERGLVESFGSPGGNLTGIDTDDGALTGKRLELLRQAFPYVQRVWMLHAPSITPSVDGLASARQAAAALGVELVVIDVETHDDIVAAAQAFGPETADALLILPAAPIWEAMADVLRPLSLAHSVPIFGVNRQDLARGAVLSYAASRYDAGVQAASIVDQVLQGGDPAVIPVERPAALEFLANRQLLEELGLTLPDDVWRIVDEAVD